MTPDSTRTKRAPKPRMPMQLKDGVKGKAYIRPVTTNVLEPSNGYSQWITGKFHEKLDKKYLTWTKVPLEDKNDYFKEFGKGFEWEKADEGAIRKAWHVKAGKCYAQLRSRARNAVESPTYILDDV